MSFARGAFPFALLLAAFVGGMACSQLTFVKKRLPPPQRVEGGIQFQFASPSAHVVQLCGSWESNNWCAGLAETGGFRVGEMQDDDADGIWTRIVDLPPGRYQYKFKIDETNWKEDPNNPDRTDDGFGGFNSVIIVD
jgi:1,4-alpha-glucan branching enzyme